MRTVRVTYGVGFGRHHDSFQVEDDEADEEIESMAQQLVMDKLDWGLVVEDEA